MDSVRTFSLEDHLGPFAAGFAWLVSIVEVFAILILVLGLLRFGAAFIGGEALRRRATQRSHALNTGRIELARHILAALEVFIVADVMRTVLEMSLENLLFLGLLVIIRSAISFMLEREMRHIEQAEDAEP